MIDLLIQVIGGEAAVFGGALLGEVVLQGVAVAGVLQMAHQGAAKGVLAPDIGLVHLPEPVQSLGRALLPLHGVLGCGQVLLQLLLFLFQVGYLGLQMVHGLLQIFVLLIQVVQRLDGGDRLLLQLVQLVVGLLLEDVVLAALHHKGIQQQDKGGGEQDGDILEHRLLPVLVGVLRLFLRFRF